MNPGIERGAVVLVDTNVIVETHRTATWRALAGAFAVETVEDCVTETQTGYRRRPRRQQWIDEADLVASPQEVHAVSDPERAALAVRIGGIALGNL